ncbi:hypothetical protein TTHERM_00744710 (macronuclear) [Tetrahymena thermophila SB210]|uniref:Uncharacterized protein n=1 Tax=Tetrahymena thermophila (strain SB210) TaxID=312017 RepID=Q239V7_TETTS|nr:hypothetical protein TTHERM_00744710 [Tetrahymena thermophila SB210]EAR93301.2 hypothetical protein TTHERM_00744710 [Tetrahymena thermophila SB210]|eukprot:XP_001013546.2 hypothetical protein TTHERM_00744710 [Tetrahymena thermophila SB210]
MSQDSAKENNVQKQNISLCKMKNTKELTKNYRENNKFQSIYNTTNAKNTLFSSNNFENFKCLSPKLDQLFNQQKTDFQEEIQEINKGACLSTYKDFHGKEDLNADIQDYDSQQTIKPINSFIVKSFSQNLEDGQDDINIQSIFTSNNPDSLQMRVNYSQIQKSEASTSTETSVSQSKSFFGEDQDERENSLKISTQQKVVKYQLSGLKNSLHKTVIFQDLPQKQSASANQFFQDRSKKPSKSILKKFRTFEINSEQQRDDLDVLQAFQSNMDFCNIKKEEFIQKLIQNEAYKSKYFFSEFATKIYNSGEKKKKIIFMTHDSFYVLQDLFSQNKIQKFYISEINKIKIHSEQTNICTIVLKQKLKLNLQILHLKEFQQFIQSVFKCFLNSSILIIQQKKQQLIEEYTKINANNNKKSQIESFLDSQKKEFYINIQIISSVNQQKDFKILGLLQFLSNSICITGLEKFKDLNRLQQVELLHKDLQKRSFLFKSLRNADQQFLIKLLNDEEFPQFVQQIQNAVSQAK